MISYAVVFSINVSSFGDLEIGDLASMEANASLGSNDSAIILVSEQLEPRVNRTGNVRYLGNLTVDASLNSAGGVIQIGE